MHEFSLFLLQHWLPVGIASITFFLVGMMIAKFIWGRYSQRLSFAVDENMNLASQWSALGASQRDLFKKLRSRWQDDREAWEARLAETEEALLDRDARITQLSHQLKSDGKTVPAEIEIDQGLRQEVAGLRAELESREAELKELKAEVELREEGADLSDPMPLGLGGTIEGSVADEKELEKRIRDLEQDLIDTHDELHDVRAGYHKQVELVEVLEARLETQDKQAQEVQESGSEISDLKSKLEEQETQARQSAQFLALSGQRGREIQRFRAQLAEVNQENASLNASLEEALDKAEFEKEVESLRELVEEKEGELEGARGDLAKANSEAEELRASISEQETSIKSLQDDLEKANEMDRRRVLLQSELNDACHEMYDVRKALNHRLDEIELLEARLDELELVEEEKEQLEATLHEVRHELSDLRLSHEEKSAEVEQQGAQMEELEAIIEDRGAEVNDLSSELRQKRDQLRESKESLAQKEGELEALSFESESFNKKLSAKEEFQNDQTRRIADLEQALTERYRELNEVRALYDEKSKSARYHASRADQVESELERRKGEFEESDLKVATAEQALDEANLKLENLTEELNNSEATIAHLQGQLQAVSREKDDTIRELERASKRVEELENATSEREQRIQQFERDWREAVSQSEKLKAQLEKLQQELEEFEKKHGTLQAENSELNRQIDAGSSQGEKLSRRVVELEQRIAQLQTEVEEAQGHRDEARESISKLEVSLSSSDERVLALSSQIEEQERELEDWKLQVDALASEVEEREKAVKEAEAARDDFEQRIAATTGYVELLRAKQTGLPNEASEEFSQLKANLEEKERLANSLVEQRNRGMAEIERLRLKVSKRGESIRELQNEVSNIMMQRADRDNEISLLKNKLRAVESELDAARMATDQASQSAITGSSVIQDLEITLQKTLSGEISGGGGMSLDELAEQNGHHAPGSQPSDTLDVTSSPGGANESEAAENPEPSGSSSGSPEIYFAEHSAELNESAKQAIDQLARRIRKDGKPIAVSIIGFAGSEGTQDFAERLSAQRADAVRERLLARGVAQTVLTVRGAGQDRRFTDARARRVDLILESKALAEAVN